MSASGHFSSRLDLETDNASPPSETAGPTDGQNDPAKVFLVVLAYQRANSDFFRSYELPHRIYTAKVYPTPSPNGSTIIVYGHEHGLRILWRGGRPLKVTAPPKEKVQVNGAGGNSDAIMIIDSDEDEAPPPAPKLPLLDEPEFEDEEEEFDPSEPYLPIIQELDLILGTDVMEISFPSISPRTHAKYSSQPALFSQSLVIAAACADRSVRVITLPLLPPSRASKERTELKDNVTLGNCGNGAWGERMVTIGGNSGHQDVPTSISISFTSQVTPSSREDTDMDEGDGLSRNPRSTSKRRSTSRSQSRSGSRGREWDLLVASYSDEISGLLLISRLPLASTDKSSQNISTGHIIPSQTQYLSAPAKSIHFNPSLYPSKRHSQLLISDTRGAIRIYDCLSHPSRHRSSSYGFSSSSQGSWLISLYAPFASPPKDAPTTSARKQIISATWIVGGRAVAVLLADGEWGIWDIEGVGPTAPKSLLGAAGTGTVGISGGATTSFSLRGWVDGSSASSTASRRDVSARTGGGGSNSSGRSGKLAPMTPSTRRVREEALFSGPAGTTSSGGIPHGSLSVSSRQSTTNDDDDHDHDETVLIYYGANLFAIPSLLSYWRRQSQSSSSGGSLFNTSPDRILKIQGLDLKGELISNGIEQIPSTSAPPSMREILIPTNTRILILSTPSGEPTVNPDIFAPTRPQIQGSSRLGLAPPPSQLLRANANASDNGTADQQLLARGELDIGGVDRLLTSMAGPFAGSRPQTRAPIRNKSGRRVGFAR
ncbi:MAG: hypothetical protein M1819_000540 [Sarea resinae]|nr:MAG: hypothetical protein M1819_000540 [Sarea resinae]